MELDLPLLSEGPAWTHRGPSHVSREPATHGQSLTEPVQKQDDYFLLIKRNTHRVARSESHGVQKCLLGRV